MSHIEINNQNGQPYDVLDYERGMKACLAQPKPHYQKIAFTDSDGITKDRMIFTIKHGKAEGVPHSTNLFDIVVLCERKKHDVRKGILNTFSNGVTAYTVNLDHQLDEAEWKAIVSAVNCLFNIPEGHFLHEFYKK